MENCVNDRRHVRHTQEWRQEQLQRLRSLGEEMFQRTKNVTEFSADILIDDPIGCLRFYSLLTHRTLDEISQLAGLKPNTVRSLAFGRSIAPSRDMAEKIMATIKTICQSQGLPRNPRRDFEDSLRYQLLFDWKQGEVKASRKYPPISRMNEQQFAELCYQAREGTRDFTDFDAGVLMENPQSLLVFRIILNASRNVMAKVLGAEQKSAIEKYENAIKPFRRRKTAEKYMAELEEIFHALDLAGNVNLERTLENFRVLKWNTWAIRLEPAYKHLAGRHSQLSRNSITCQEQALIEDMEQAGITCYTPTQPKPREPCCMIHAPLWDGHRIRYVDFAYCDSRTPKAVIECITVESTSKEVPILATQDRGRLVLKCYPNAKFIIAIHGSRQPIVVPPYYLDLPDTVFTDANVQNLPAYLKRLNP